MSSSSIVNLHTPKLSPSSVEWQSECIDGKHFAEESKSLALTDPATNTTQLRHKKTTFGTASESDTIPPQQPSKLRNNHISIVSLEDDVNSDDERDDINSINQDDDGNCSSSIADSSDSDLDNISVNLSTFLAANGILPQQSTMNADGKSSSTALNGMIVINNGPTAAVVAENCGIGSNAHQQRPHIGSIALQNSTDITFGDKTFYQGPVTVKQFFLEKDQWMRSNTKTVDGTGLTIGTVPSKTTTSGPKSTEGYDNDTFVETMNAKHATETEISSKKGIPLALYVMHYPYK